MQRLGKTVWLLAALLGGSVFAADTCATYHFDFGGGCVGATNFPTINTCENNRVNAAYTNNLSKEECETYGSTHRPNWQWHKDPEYKGEVDDANRPPGCIKHANQDHYMWNVNSNGVFTDGWWRIVCYANAHVNPGWESMDPPNGCSEQGYDFGTWCDFENECRPAYEAAGVFPGTETQRDGFPCADGSAPFDLDFDGVHPRSCCSCAGTFCALPTTGWESMDPPNDCSEQGYDFGTWCDSENECGPAYEAAGVFLGTETQRDGFPCADGSVPFDLDFDGVHPRSCCSCAGTFCALSTTDDSDVPTPGPTMEYSTPAPEESVTPTHEPTMEYIHVILECPTGYDQVGTLNSDNDIAGEGLGQSTQPSMNACQALCEATAECVAFMYGGWDPDQTDLCELADTRVPNNNWGANFIFCASNDSGVPTHEPTPGPIVNEDCTPHLAQAGWCTCPTCVLKVTDCDGDNLPDHTCIDTFTMRRTVLLATTPNCTSFFERVAQDFCPSAFDEWSLGTPDVVAVQKFCTSLADPHMRCWAGGSALHGAPWEFQTDYGDYILYTGKPGHHHNPITVVGRFEQYNYPNTSHFSSMTAIAFEGPLTCGMRIEIYMWKEVGVYGSQTNEPFKVYMFGTHPATGVALPGLTDFAAVRAALLTCDQVIFVSSLALMTAGNGYLQIRFMGFSEMKIQSYATGRALYGINYYLYLNPNQRDPANDFGMCPDCAAGRIHAHCTEEDVRTLLTQDLYYPDGSWGQNKRYCSEVRRRRLGGGDPFAGLVATGDVDAQREASFKDTIGNCDDTLKADAGEACAACFDRWDGQGDLGYNACIFDACQMGGVEFTDSMTDGCARARDAGTDVAVKALLVRHMFDQFDSNSNGRLDMSEFNDLMVRRDLQGETVTEAEFLALLTSIGAAGNEFTKDDFVKLYEDPDVAGYDCMADYNTMAVDNGDIDEIPPEELAKADFDNAVAMMGYEEVGDGGTCTSRGQQPAAWETFELTKIECQQAAEATASKTGFAVGDLQSSGCRIYVSDSNLAFPAGWTKIAGVNGAIDGSESMSGVKCYAPSNRAVCDLDCTTFDRVRNFKGFCAGHLCADATDRDNCCLEKQTCADADPDAVNCPAGFFFTTGGTCHGAVCTSDYYDKEACCAQQAPCDGFDCGAEKELRFEGFCAGAVCDPHNDLDNCCFEREPCPSPQPCDPLPDNCLAAVGGGVSIDHNGCQITGCPYCTAVAPPCPSPQPCDPLPDNCEEAVGGGVSIDQNGCQITGCPYCTGFACSDTVDAPSSVEGLPCATDGDVCLTSDAGKLIVFQCDTTWINAEEWDKPSPSPEECSATTTESEQFSSHKIVEGRCNGLRGETPMTWNKDSGPADVRACVDAYRALAENNPDYPGPTKRVKAVNKAKYPKGCIVNKATGRAFLNKHKTGKGRDGWVSICAADSST